MPYMFYSKNDLSHIKIALFVGCHTADTEDNLPLRFKNLGADFALGFKDNITCNAANAFVKAFVDNLADGRTADEAAKKAEKAASQIDSRINSMEVFMNNDVYYTLPQRRV